MTEEVIFDETRELDSQMFERVVAMDDVRGPLVVMAVKDMPAIRLCLRAPDSNAIVYRTYARTNDRDAEGRPIYR